MKMQYIFFTFFAASFGDASSFVEEKEYLYVAPLYVKYQYIHDKESY